MKVREEEARMSHGRRMKKTRRLKTGRPFSRLNEVLAQVKRGNEENTTGPNEETDPHVKELLNEAQRIQNELDPLVREIMRDDPAALAQWDKLMHMCDDLKEEEKEAAEEHAHKLAN
jgi:hypothetical protein